MIKKLVLSCLAATAFFPALARAGYIFINENPANVTIRGGDYEGGLQANGQNIDTNYSGTQLTVSLGTPINFSGALVDDGATAAGNQHIYVLPFAGANFAIADLSLSNTASTNITTPAGLQTGYSITGTYNSGENIAVPSGASSIVFGSSASFSTVFSSNALTTVVPEPSTWALLGVGIAGLGVVTLRRHRLPRTRYAA